MVETDIEVRWIIQREMHLQDETQALKSTLDNYGNGEDGVDILKPQQLIAYERELSGMEAKNDYILWSSGWQIPKPALTSLSPVSTNPK